MEAAQTFCQATVAKVWRKPGSGPMIKDDFPEFSKRGHGLGESEAEQRQRQRLYMDETGLPAIEGLLSGLWTSNGEIH